MSEKYQFTDRFRFNGVSNKPENFNNKRILRPIRAVIQSDVHKSSQVQQALSYQS
jgi:hypothetical protein